jgi:hypothetical protein
MPANKYTRSLYKAGTVKAEKAAIANRDPARKKAAEKIMKREGTTSPGGGLQRLRCRQRHCPLNPINAKTNPLCAKMQVIRTTTNMTANANVEQETLKCLWSSRPAKPRSARTSRQR